MHLYCRSTGAGIYLCSPQEIGPYEIGWKRRKHAWTEAANILFIDNPVGTGWSYVSNHGSFGERLAETACSHGMHLCVASWRLVLCHLVSYVIKHSRFGERPRIAEAQPSEPAWRHALVSCQLAS